MAYPPPVPPTGRVNATPQVDNHPSDHNVISTALTEIINHIAVVEANITALTRRVGVGVFTGSQLIGNGQNPKIIWTGEAYDTDGFHAANAGDIVIPGGLDAIYSCTMTVECSGPMTTGFSGLVQIHVPGPATKQNIIVGGQTRATVNYTGPLSAAGVLYGSFYNGGADNFIAASLEVLRVSQ